MKQLSLCYTTTEPVLWILEAETTEACEPYKPTLHRSHRSEKPSRYNEEWTPLTAIEKACMQ